jgi:hypothetical protein
MFYKFHPGTFLTRLAEKNSQIFFPGKMDWFSNYFYIALLKTSLQKKGTRKAVK